MTLAGEPVREIYLRSRELLDAVGLEKRAKHRLAELSGGEQQRVAIAVALANNPLLLLADEPTGSLDSKTGKSVMEVLHRLNGQYGLTTIIVTHDPNISRSVERVVTIRDGKTSTERVRRSGEAAVLSAAESEHYREYVVLDSAGRLQIPPNIREELNIGDRVELDHVEDGILIRPVASANRNARVTGSEDITGDEETSARSHRKKRREKRSGGLFRSRKQRRRK